MSNHIHANSEEIWNIIPNFPGYHASTHGNIKSLDRIIVRNDGRISKRNGVKLKHTKRTNQIGCERFYVTMSISGKQITRGVSTLVAETFLSKPVNISSYPLQVGHQDGNPLNNNLSNLKWETRSENMRHAHRTGLIKYEKGGKHFNSKQIMQYNIDGDLVKIWDSVTEASIALGIGQANIATCARGGEKICGGYFWKYPSSPQLIKENLNDSEIWDYITESQNLYQVSNQGLVRSVDRTIVRNDGFKVVYKGKLLRHSLLNGYCTILLSSIKKRFFVHTLVATVFIKKRPSRNHVVDHKDDNKTNNNVSNLQWITRKQNIQKAYYTQVATKPKGAGHYSSKPIDQYTIKGEFVKSWDSTADVCRFLNKKNTNNIYDNLKGNRKSAYGYIWKYRENLPG
jgi:hypothetical protein